MLAAWDGESWEQIGGGTNDTVFAVGTYDFGDGEELLIGGNFSSVGGAAGIRMSFFGGYDGIWRNRGTVNGIVRAFGSYNGDLIIGGDFTTVNGQPRSHIARWDGDSWQPLGTGMDGSVFALTEYNGELIAGGRFETAGGVFTTQIAAWDGESWRMLGAGLADGLIETWVWSLAVRGDDLIAAGEFTTADFDTANRVARWDGEAWHPLGEGTSHTVYALAVHNDDVVAGGQFAQAGGEPASRIARWVECPDCIADWNGDGEVDINDFFAYLDDFEAGDPRADLNNDGEIDINDFFIFLSEFEAGC